MQRVDVHVLIVTDDAVLAVAAGWHSLGIFPAAFVALGSTPLLALCNIASLAQTAERQLVAARAAATLAEKARWN